MNTRTLDGRRRPRSLSRAVGLVIGLLVLVAAPLAAMAPAAVASSSNNSAASPPADPGAAPGPAHKVIFPTQEASAAGVGNDGVVRGDVSATAISQLRFGGGVDGIGVTTGAPKVYLVFWGTQWGAASVNPADGYTHFSGDPAGAAPRLQALFAGVGTNNELWSGVMTQYCEGVAAGATSCPSSSSHVGYPAGGALAGIWNDTTSAEPTKPTDNALAREAIAAAAHFGNVTPTQNRNVQYVVISPTGVHPGGFNTPGANWCAWHDWNGDTTLVGGAATSPYGDIAFTNLPYVTDLGASCGQSYVNAGSAGALDGVTIVEGHEYAETITDQNPAGGWTDSTGNETADKCAWNGVGGSGGAQNVAMATGSFAMQATWSNAVSACQIAHAVVTNGPPANTITVTNPGAQSSTVGQTVSLAINATDSGGAPMTYAATGLPAGLSINATTGVIAGTIATAGTSNVSITVTDSTGGLGTAAFSWTVPQVCAATQAVGNSGFDTGSATPWTISSSRILNNSTTSLKEPPHSPQFDAWLGGLGTSHVDTVSQKVTLPTGCKTYSLSFWLHIDTAETSAAKATDRLTVQLGSTTLATYSNVNKNSGYVQKTFNVASSAGKTVTLTFTATENGSRQTSFVIDDVTANAS